VKVDDPDSNAWDKPAMPNRAFKGETAQYASFCNELRGLGSSTRRKNAGKRQLSYVLAALKLHDPRWTEELLRRVVAAWQSASAQKDIAERIAELCNIAVARAKPGEEATYSGTGGPKWPVDTKSKRSKDTLRLGYLWDNMKNKNKRFKEFAEAMVARGWSEKEVHALVDANRSEAQRAKFPLKE
tara:strand:+ start:991 stop:1545 length:555 start_codon:yes stop_codon:yes gene_type:complete